MFLGFVYMVCSAWFTALMFCWIFFNDSQRIKALCSSEPHEGKEVSSLITEQKQQN